MRAVLEELWGATRHGVCGVVGGEATTKSSEDDRRCATRGRVISGTMVKMNGRVCGGSMNGRPR